MNAFWEDIKPDLYSKALLYLHENHHARYKGGESCDLTLRTMSDIIAVLVHEDGCLYHLYPNGALRNYRMIEHT